MQLMADTVQTTAPHSRRPRADAERNRRALLEAAVEVFGERGLDATVSEVAKRAGVGQGTAFRHYPTKEKLVAAVACDCIGRMTAVATALMSEPDPLEALRAFMLTAVEMQSVNRGLIEAGGAEAVLADVEVRAGKERLNDAASQLLRRAQDAGVVRADLVPEDIPMLVSAISFAGAPHVTQTPSTCQRYFELVFDALRPDGATPLSAPAPENHLLAHLRETTPPTGC